MSDDAPHLTELPGTEWRVWRDGLLRSAGFPVDVLESFAAPACAAVADAYLDGEADADAYAAAFDRATAELGQAVYDISADPRFREAIVWQNPNALNGPAGVVRDGPAARRNERRRRREEVVAKYAQRYSGKNDTIGFFGPMCWVTVDADAPLVSGGHGAGLTRVRRVFFEWWALVAVAERIAADPAVRPWLRVTLQPHLWVDGRRLATPNRPPTELSAAQAAVLSRCDGRATARDVALACVADADARREADVYATLDQYVQQEIVRWEFVLPMNLAAESALADQVAAIGDEPARERAQEILSRFRATKDVLAAAEGPDAVAAAMTAMEAEFTAITGLDTHHRDGETYAGRTLCHLETTRDARFTFGREVLAALAPLDPLLRSTRWLTSTLSDTYRAELTRLYTELSAELGTAEVPFAQLWYLGLGLFFGTDRPADAVVEEFGRRWTKVLGLDEIAPGTERLELTSGELTAAVRKEFDAVAPGWATSRLQSPDVHLCAPSADALARGEFTVVLGEVHMGMPALDTDFFRVGHDDEARLLAAMRADVPFSRAHPLVPADWPRQCARNADWMYGADDVQLGFTPAPGADPDRLLPITALTVTTDDDTDIDTDGELVARAPDGRQWPLMEMFADFVGTHAFDTWKLAGTDGHTPRISVDGLVLVRRTWRCTVAETGLADVSGERDRYLAVRRWGRALGLPQRVFVRVGTEIKPCFVDLTSPVFTRILCTLLRSARRTGGDDTSVVVTEMLPTPDQAWLTDSEGRRYCSELRLHMYDRGGAADG
jgi:hypothetical protein